MSTTPAEKTPHVPSRPKIILKHGKVYHMIALLLSLATAVLPIVAYFTSAGYDMDMKAGELGRLPWLVTINQTMASTIKIDGDVESKTLDGDVESKTLRSWGLGTFGWCEWNYNSVDMLEKGKCVKHAAWTLPGSAQQGDGILAIEMSTGLSKLLSPVSHLLVIALLLMSAYFLMLVWAYTKGCPKTRKCLAKNPKDPNPDQEDPKQWYFVLDPDTREEDRLYFILRGWWGRSTLIVSLIIVVVVIITMTVGVVEINKWDQQNLQAEFGSGGTMLCVSAVALLIIGLLVQWGGLRVKTDFDRPGVSRRTRYH